MRTCNKCNAPLDDDAKFCESCGAMAEAAPTSSTDTEPESPPAQDAAIPEETQAGFCQECGGSLVPGMEFCQECGAKATALPASADPQPEPSPDTAAPEEVQAEFCHECGRPIAPGMMFCQECGTPIHQSRQQPAAVPTQPQSAPRAKLPFSMKTAAIAAAVLVIVVGVLLFVNLRGGAATDLLLYLKDSEIVCTNLRNQEFTEITSRLYEGDMDHYQITSDFGTGILLSKDGRRLFYPDRITEFSHGIILYTRDMKNPKSEGVKIDSEITDYFVNDNADKIFYTKGSEAILYESDFTNKDKIDSEVERFFVTKDGKKVLYILADGTIYTKVSGKDKEKLDSSSQLIHFNEDLTKVYYLKEGSLYIKDGVKDKEKIASDVESVYKVYDSGEMYYSKTAELERSLADFVDDDLKSGDDALSEPEMPTAPNYSDFDNLDDYYAARDVYNEEYEEYRSLADAYRQKLQRDEMRDYFRAETVTTTQRTLYYYDGATTTAVTDALRTVMSTGGKRAVIAYQNFNTSAPAALKISEISGVQEVYSAAEASASHSSEIYLAAGATAGVLDATNADYFFFNDSSNKMYYLDDYSYESGSGDMMVISIGADGTFAKNEYESDVSYFEFLDGTDHLIYFRDMKNGVGDLYVDKVFVDSDVHQYFIENIEGSGSFTYYTDWSENSRYGTLKIYNGKESKKIADDVTSHYILADHKVAYLSDYSTKSYRGDAYLYTGTDKKEKIDDDVQAFIRTNYASNYRGRNSYGV